jgi:hypothetical protein
VAQDARVDEQRAERRVRHPRSQAA